MGTPTIGDMSSADGVITLSIRFHYYPKGPNPTDFPGIGTVEFPDVSEGVVEEFTSWSGRHDDDVYDPLRNAGVVGKIGQRTEITTPAGKKFILVEGQMAENGEGGIGWLSWRIHLHQLKCSHPAVLPLELPSHLKTFANPRATLVNDSLYMNFFVPS